MKFMKEYYINEITSQLSDIPYYVLQFLSIVVDASNSASSEISNSVIEDESTKSFILTIKKHA